MRSFEGGYLRRDALRVWDVWDALLENKPMNLNGMLLGTHQENKERQLHVSYTSINIFSHFLSDQEMSDITGCQADPNGDYLAWNETK